MAVDDALDLAGALRRNDGSRAPGWEVLQHGVSVVALVAEQDLGRWPRFIHHRAVAPDVGNLAAGQDHGDR